MFGFRRSGTLRALMFFIVSGVVMCFPLGGRADVATDGSVGPNKSLSGPDFVIPDTLGTSYGTNLFHSFQKFSITQDQSATFTGPDTINNVISRVTGGEISNIDGLLRSEVGQANFFFINPSGVVFGKNARVDVPAAFHVSTADALNFEDGSVFSASAPDTSTLTMAPPESFGFLGVQSTSIEINGALLEFKPGSQVSLTSGDITIQGSVTQDSQLQSDAGKIQLTGMGTTTGDIPIAGILTTDPAGTLTLNLAHVETSGNGGGHVLVQAGNVDMNAAIIAADNTGSSLADGGVDMVVDGPLTLAHGSRVQSNVFGEGNSGGIRIEAETLLIEQAVNDDFTSIVTGVQTEASGNAGSIDITVAGLVKLINGSQILSATLGEGDAGSVNVKAGEMIIDDQGGEAATGIVSLSVSEGNSGFVTITVDGLLQLINGAEISSTTTATGDAGSVDVTVGEMILDGQESNSLTGIDSQTTGEGNASSIQITVDGLLQLLNGGYISSSTTAQGDGGSVNVNAGEMIIDDQGTNAFTGVISASSSEGNAGSVTIMVDGLLQLLNAVYISSSTLGTGNAGSIHVTAGEMIIDDQDSGPYTGITSDARLGSEGNAGSVQITVDGLLQLLNGARISSSTYAKGDAGNVNVTAGEMIIDDQGSEDSTEVASEAKWGSEGNAGSVQITVDGLLQLINGGVISSSTFGKGDAGSINVTAGEMIVDGQGSVAGVGAISGFDGNAGSVQITVDGLLQLINGASILSNTFGKGDAGSVNVTAGEICIDAQGSEYLTGISTSAEPDSEGNASSVQITVDGLLQLINGAQISSSTYAKGDAGNVNVTAGEMSVDGQGSEGFTGVGSISAFEGGNAGPVQITVDGLLQLINGAQISSSTYARGDAGSIHVNAGEMFIDAQGSEFLTGVSASAEYGSEGNAGSIQITVEGLLQLINVAQILSGTFSKGDAGNVTINAGSMSLDGQNSDFVTGITSSAGSDSEGNAGTVEVNVAGLMEMTNGSQIQTMTWGKGNAGNLKVNAGSLDVNGETTGIYSSAAASATGSAGNVAIHAGDIELADGGKISITADQTLLEESLSAILPNSINITARNLHLNQNAEITAESAANVPAGAINLQSDSILVENSSRITTASNDADGGPITLQGNIVFLNDALITTSVNGIAGDGGDITITGVNNDDGREVPLDALVMKGGFIQANTGAADARGGNITINARAVVVDAMGGLQVGGEERQEFQPGQYLNVIQAAAPGGEKGTINITAPDIDISGSLANVGTYFVNPALLATNPCVATTGEPESSLIQGGRGGIPETPDDFSSVSYMGHRLDQIFNEDN